MIDRFKPIAVALLLAAMPASAEAVNISERAQLWNSCKPMRLTVERLSDDSASIGLAQEAIEVAARSRLRAARLYVPDIDATVPILYIRVSVGGVAGIAFSIEIDYMKPVLDVITGLPLHANTWESGGIGTHGADSNYILQSVAQYVDGFIDEYLRVNSDACGQPSYQ